MALIACSECGREISDKASACPGCGAPVHTIDTTPAKSSTPTSVAYDRATDTFSGTSSLVVKLAMRAVQDCGWKIDQANDAIGLVTFQTGMSWGSWSGVIGSLNVEEIASGKFRVTGTGKQNVSGMQLVAFNIGGEAQGKAKKVIERMKEIAASRA